MTDLLTHYDVLKAQYEQAQKAFDEYFDNVVTPLSSDVVWLELCDLNDKKVKARKEYCEFREHLEKRLCSDVEVAGE